MNKVFSLTRDRLNAFSSPVRPSSRQYSVNATNSTDIRDKRPDISETYKLSESTKRAYEYSVLSDFMRSVLAADTIHLPDEFITSSNRLILGRRYVSKVVGASIFSLTLQDAYNIRRKFQMKTFFEILKELIFLH